MGLLRMAARTAVVAGTATAVSGRVSRRQAARYDQQQAAEAPPEAAPAPEPPPQDAAAPAPPRTTSIAQIQNLAQLHSQGVLSDEEFAAAKAKILGI